MWSIPESIIPKIVPSPFKFVFLLNEVIPVLEKLWISCVSNINGLSTYSISG